MKARTRAVVAALCAVGLLVVLVAGRPRGILAVGLALLCVLLGMVAAMAVTAARHGDDRGPVEPTPAGQPRTGLYGVDADTLETLDNEEAVRALRERYRRLDGLNDR
ncbi:hypothetical protein [Micromonospora siamensis]|uniref:Uncharacterized protein n=1 Tax=Micromonospora siamensis TaxID=299152 RepID=A0A1C5GQF1_9ACTN|nr:hypothetical protein [Micromonospora siamensis]SCG35943.1 hypothetical protein GA0074704_0292 [Micromonospora siamensis]